MYRWISAKQLGQFNFIQIYCFMGILEATNIIMYVFGNIRIIIKIKISKPGVNIYDHHLTIQKQTKTLIESKQARN